MLLSKTNDLAECSMDSKSIIYISDLEIGFAPAAKRGLFYPLINLTVEKGDFIALVGKNGIGKSTFLRTIACLQPPLAGEINILGKPFKDYNRVNFAKTVSFIPAEPIHAANMTVFEFVSLARYPYNGWFGSIEQSDRELIHSALENVRLSAFVNRELDSLSDGERQRAMIAFAIAQDSEIILMDEPTAFIDLPSKFEIVHLLKELTLKGKTVIFSTHDLHTAIRMVDTIWLMLEDGFRVGPPEELALNGSLNKLFENTEIYLDLKSGNFLSRQESTLKVKVISDNEIYLTWTTHALERLGFKVIYDVDESIPVVICKMEENLWIWEYNFSSILSRFDSISKLCKFLKSNVKSTL
jgi:iron complex transport system ATP-binding protein